MKLNRATFWNNLTGRGTMEVMRWEDGTAYITIYGPRNGLLGGIPLSETQAKQLAALITGGSE